MDVEVAFDVEPRLMATRRQGLKRIKKRRLTERSEFRTLPVSVPGGACSPCEFKLERELYNGELSDFRNALIPIVAAGGGIAVPALIHFGLNNGTPTQAGIGIPMATDIAFALELLALLGSRVPESTGIS
jgi:hypothetical protein